MSSKRKSSARIAQPASRQNAKKVFRTNINEADTEVSTADFLKTSADKSTDDVIEISSDADSSDFELDGDEAEGDDGDHDVEGGDAGAHKLAASQLKTPPADRKTAARENGNVDQDATAEGESDQEPAPPTFGDLIRANETIDVPASLSAQQSTALTVPGRQIAAPSHASLGTVLTQALRTDDTDLLESCLHTNDLTTIRNTIQRLDSSLAGALLTKLAARMHRRPGRAGSMLTWVQWTLIAHGGALATQPGLAQKLSELHRVLEERSRGLNSLLTLKGKLDLLEAQMQLRRSMRNSGLGEDDDEDEDEDEGVVYVEGEEDDADHLNGALDAEDDEMPVTNGILDEASEDDDEFSDEDEDEDELEGAEEPMDENEVDYDDVESAGEDEDSEPEAAPPAKLRKTGGPLSKRR